MNATKILTVSVLALGLAATAQAAPRNKAVDASRVTQNVTVNYQCQDGRVAVRYGFNAAGVPVNASAKVNGATRVMKYDMGASDNVDAFFKDARGYRLTAEAFELKNVRRASIANIASPSGDLVFKDCSPRR